MSNTRTITVLALLATTLSGLAASAQPVSRRVAPSTSAPPLRGFVSINGGYQFTRTRFGDSYNFTLNQETGSTRLTYRIESAAMLDVGGGVRIWRQLGAGVAVSRFSRAGPVAASSSIPHPFFFQQHREVAGDGEGLRREETGIHLQAQYSLLRSKRFVVTVMGGPSFLHVNQAVAIDVNYSEEYPYDTASFTGVDTATRKASAVGFNAGADVRWMVARQVGLGLLVRVTRAAVDLEVAQGRTASVKAGGAHVGAGLRVGF